MVLTATWLLVLLRFVWRSGMLQTASPLELLGTRNSSRAVPVNSTGPWLKWCSHCRKLSEQIPQKWDLKSSCVICSHLGPSFIPHFGATAIWHSSNPRRFFQEGSGRCISYLVLPPHCGRRLVYEFLGALTDFDCSLSRGTRFIPVSMKSKVLNSFYGLMNRTNVGDTWDI